MLDRVTDPAKIRETLDSFVSGPARKATFIVEIFSREHRPGGIVYEGCRPIGACQTDEKRTYTLANGDSNYQLSLVVLDLSNFDASWLLVG